MERPNNGIDGHPAASHLPQDIMLYNILPRIPDMDLHRFRCVCKPWSNLPHDPLFKSSYSPHRSKSAYNERGFISCKEEYFVGGDEDALTTYYFSFLDIDNKECKQIPFQIPDDHYGAKILSNGADVSIKDSFNGVLLVRFEIHCAHNNRYYVYNPACGGWVLITTHSEFGDLDFTMEDYSLAYDPIISRYKVVGYDKQDFCIFTVGEDHEWRRVSKPRHYSHILGKPAVYVNNCLHWICRKKGTTDYGDILRFDACKEEASIIKLPVKGSSTSRRLLEMGGLLWFIHSVHGHNNRLKLWYLKKKKKHNGGYRDHGWVAKCTVNLETCISSQQLIRYSWSREPVIIVADPKCRIIFTFVDRKEKKRRYTYSYDMELKQWDLIQSGPAVCYEKKDFDEHEFHYWYDNKNALSTYGDCDWYFPAR